MARGDLQSEIHRRAVTWLENRPANQQRERVPTIDRRHWCAARWTSRGGSPRTVGADVGGPQPGDIPGALVCSRVGAGRHRRHAAQLVDRLESLARHPCGQPGCTVACSGPWRSSAEAVITISAPASRYLATSGESSTPDVAASAARTPPRSSAIHLCGSSASTGPRVRQRARRREFQGRYWAAGSG